MTVTEEAKLGTAADLGLEGKGSAPEIRPCGFLLKYEPPTLILEYASTATLQCNQPQQLKQSRGSSKSKLRLAAALEGSRSVGSPTSNTAEQFFRLQIFPSRGWFSSVGKDEKERSEDARRIAVKLQRRYDRFMGKEKVKTKQLAAVVQKLIENCSKAAKAKAAKKLKWSDEAGLDLEEIRMFICDPSERTDKPPREVLKKVNRARKAKHACISPTKETQSENVAVGDITTASPTMPRPKHRRLNLNSSVFNTTKPTKQLHAQHSMRRNSLCLNSEDNIHRMNGRLRMPMAPKCQNRQFPDLSMRK
jgi:hypothetical protein